MREARDRFAVIGCGRISQVHLSALQANADVELVAVADVDLPVAQGIAEAWGARAFGDAEEMLRATAPDAVVLCTPPDTHRELALTALRSGAHVLCEKPLTIRPDHARAMLDAASENGRLLMMASKFRYVTDIVKARAILHSGVLGSILAFENSFCAHVDMSHRWNSRRDVAGGGVLIDNGTHSVDIVRYLLGPIVQVQAIQGAVRQPLEVEDSCHLFCRVERQTVASITLSWSFQASSDWYITIYGSDGTLQIGWRQSRYRPTEKADWIDFGSGYDKFDAVARQLSDFIGAMRGECIPLIGPEEAFESVRVISAAYRSMQNRSWESLEP